MNRVRAPVHLLCLSLVALLLPVSPSVGQGAPQEAAETKDFPGIEKLMTAEEFARTGLDGLSKEQLVALNDWLVQYTAGQAAVVQSTSRQVREAAANFRIEASVVQPFMGWTGQTVFRLDNGQVWRQRIKGRYTHASEDSRVLITRNLLGFYVLTLVSTGRSIGVEPIRKESGVDNP